MYVDSSGTYGPAEGQTIVNGDVYTNVDATLQNLDVNGTLYVNPGDTGVVTLNNVTADQVTVQSGDVNSIHVNNSNIALLIVDDSNGVRIVLQGNSQVINAIVYNNPGRTLLETDNTVTVTSVTVDQGSADPNEYSELYLDGIFNGITINAPISVAVDEASNITDLQVSSEDVIVFDDNNNISNYTVDENLNYVFNARIVSDDQTLTAALNNPEVNTIFMDDTNSYSSFTINNNVYIRPLDSSTTPIVNGGIIVNGNEVDIYGLEIHASEIGGETAGILLNGNNLGIIGTKIIGTEVQKSNPSFGVLIPYNNSTESPDLYLEEVTFENFRYGISLQGHENSRRFLYALNNIFNDVDYGIAHTENSGIRLVGNQFNGGIEGIGIGNFASILDDSWEQVTDATGYLLQTNTFGDSYGTNGVVDYRVIPLGNYTQSTTDVDTVDFELKVECDMYNDEIVLSIKPLSSSTENGELAYLVINVVDSQGTVGDRSTSFERGAVIFSAGEAAAVAGGDFTQLSQSGDWYTLRLDASAYEDTFGVIATSGVKVPAHYVENTLYNGENGNTLDWVYEDFIKITK